jgi:4-hydroxybenzoate polyprenyltransferase
MDDDRYHAGTMIFSKVETIKYLQAFVRLGRISSIPTIWSNCLAGWLLSGGGYPDVFFAVCFGASCLYFGGVFLNDACDFRFDQVNRRERPIPAGQANIQTVVLCSVGWLALGALVLVSIGTVTAFFTVLLVLCIVLYDLTHKIIAFSPAIMAVCRFLLYLIAGSAAENGLGGMSVWSGVALGFFTGGVNYLEEKARSPAGVQYWPVFFLATPIFFAFLANAGGYLGSALFFSALLGAWITLSLRHIYGTPHRNIALGSQYLLAGILLVDMLSVLGGSFEISMVFLLWFAVVNLFQRVFPGV